MLVKNAAELLDANHPLHATFRKWVAAREAGSAGAVVKAGRNREVRPTGELTKRQARKFLAVPAHQRFKAPPEPKPEQPKVKGKGKKRYRRRMAKAA